MTSETDFNIIKQPLPSCPLVDNVIEEIKWILDSSESYKLMTDDELYAEIIYIRGKLKDLITPKGLIEQVRQRNIEIREFAQEWKEEAISFAVHYENYNDSHEGTHPDKQRQFSGVSIK